MSLTRKILFSLVPAVALFASLEGVCRIWEAIENRAPVLPRAAAELPKKEPGEFRVLFFGGSTVAGDPMPDVGFVEQMKYYLEEIAPSRSLRFFNYGFSGMPSTYAVRKMAQTVPGSEADAIVVLTAHNEFLPQDLNEEELKSLYAIQEEIYRSALVRRARRMIYRYHTARREKTLEADKLSRYDRESARFTERVSLFQRNLDAIAGIAKAERIPVFLCTGPSNLRDFPPTNYKLSKFYGDAKYVPALREGAALLDRRETSKAEAALNEALLRYPDDANVIFLLARARLASGDAEKARELYYLAKDVDPVPFRVLSDFNETVRGKKEVDGVRVIDLERIFDSRSPNGITGFEYIVDHCHPTPQGGFIIATSLIEAFAEAGLIETGGPVEERLSLDAFLDESGYTSNRNSVRVEYLKEAAEFCVNSPYFNLSAAQGYLSEAVKLDPKDWAAWGNLGTVYLFMGRVAEGDRCLRKAAESKGAPLDLNDREQLPLLREAIDAAGYKLES